MTEEQALVWFFAFPVGVLLWILVIVAIVTLAEMFIVDPIKRILYERKRQIEEDRNYLEFFGHTRQETEAKWEERKNIHD